ncbi:MAG: SDR family NAD(P)-dependent oxidoreductase [Motiliproteus sp.]|nr:SDR family NAD(P)-dependent oxidoreductase [Motiliproteus sp.]MCW9053553.1 SDR family NAD(P)-dependent oxidoreductase [Motiliproteus sp.]
MQDRKRIAIIGATSAIAEHCARLWLLKEPSDLILVGRNSKRMERVATDLYIRSQESNIQIIEQPDFSAPDAISFTVEELFKKKPIDIVLIAHGSLPEQHVCQDDLHTCRAALDINGVSPVLFAEAFAKNMEKANHGTIALISSVAGDRGRQSNYVYGAAKGLVSRYTQGLQHRLASSNVNILLIKPGPTDTPMTSHLKADGASLASSELVAENIVNAVASRKKCVYTPSKWFYIMLIIRHIPSFIFNKIRI